MCRIDEFANIEEDHAVHVIEDILLSFEISLYSPSSFFLITLISVLRRVQADLKPISRSMTRSGDSSASKSC